MIPKIFHFVWIGDEKKCPTACIDSWRKLNPDFQVKVWGNAEYRNHDWVFAEQMARIHETGQIYGVADLMRWEILKKYGGIALDADAVCVSPMPRWLLECTTFACWQNELSVPGLISNGYVGAHKDDPLINYLIKKLSEEKDLAYRHKFFGLKKKRRSSWKTTGPALLTKCHRELRYSNLTILPSHFFIPNDTAGDSYAGSGPIIAVQLYSSTRGSPLNYDQLAQLSSEEIIELTRPERTP